MSLALFLLAAPLSAEKNLPASFDLASGKNVKWVAALGTEAYAGPVVAGGKVFVGTNNETPRDPKVSGDRGVLMAFSAADGSFLWQAVHAKLAAGRAQDWPAQGICSTPAVVGDRLYYLSNRGEMVAVDTEGFRDGENDGPFTGETAKAKTDADVVWTLDLASLGVVPHFMSASSPLVVGDLVFVVTGNGPDDSGKVPKPDAPSFVAVERLTGKLRWSNPGPGGNLRDGQWGSPGYGVLAGKPQVIFPGGDGWLYAFAPETGAPLWKLDLNPPREEGKPEKPRDGILGAPVVAGGRVYVGLGHNPEWGALDGRLVALDVAAGGATVAWSLGGRDFTTTLSTVTLDGGVLYTADLAGFLYALDPATGKLLWKHDAFAAVWGSPRVAGGKVYLGDEDGDLAILQAGRTLKVLAEPNLGNAIYTTPVAQDGVLYVVTSNQLVALEEGASRPAPAAKE